MRLNDEQIRRLIRHACDKTGYESLSGSISVYFIDGEYADRITPIAIPSCESSNYGYRCSIKLYSSRFDRLPQSKQIQTIIQATCGCIDEYAVKAMNRRPHRYGVTRLVKKCGIKPRKEKVA
jgi:hypothetical protein